MKKFLSIICIIAIAFSIAACGGNSDDGSKKPDENASKEEFVNPAIKKEDLPEIAAPKEDIAEATDYVTQTWVAVEIPFEATDKIKDISEAEIDVTFKNRETGTTLVMPGFWDGAKDWKVRFAPTEYGIWDYSVASTGKDLGLNGKTGTLAANSYKGDLEIYKRGFVRTEGEQRYFVFNDGMPFFYLGDTHWTMLTEELDKVGNRGKGIDTDSHFKYIVDKRVEQKFTVYQSEPINSMFDVTDGNVSAGDIKGFQVCDKYFQYIADAGLVHANAELIFPSGASDKFSKNVRMLTRYWIARYAAYPVLWTLGQEVDDGKNYEQDGKVSNIVLTYSNMCLALDELDPYNHPITAHQLNAASINAMGQVKTSSADGGYGNYDPSKNDRTGTTRRSAFYDIKGHNWWGVQWRPMVDQQYNFDIPKNYWRFGGNKVAINYETRYDHLSTKQFGARAEGWISYLCGLYGYGYGAEDMWYYRSSYDTDSDSFDGVEKITIDDKQITWGELINAPISADLTRMRAFLEEAQWWRLIPNFDDGGYFIKDDAKTGYYAAASDGNDIYVAYLYAKTTDSVGSFAKMDEKATYKAQWYNPRTGDYTLISDSVAPTKTDKGYTYEIPEKPEADDMIIYLTKN